MLTDFIALAHQLADISGEIIRPYFESELVIEDKADKTPVTLADKQAEAAMRAHIEKLFPDHAIHGEEGGISISASSSSLPPRAGGAGGGSAGRTPGSEFGTRVPPSNSPRSRGEGKSYTWVLDPIDGTRAFIERRKEWGTLIALCADGVPILGLLNQPVTGERWLGVKGQPTLYNGQPCRTRPCASLGEAELSTTSASYFTPEQAAKVVKLAQSVRSTVKDGDCYAYGLLARGARDLVIDAGLKPYDILALVPIIEGAGGKITGWDGAPVTLTHADTALAAGDISLVNAALALMK